MSITKRDLEQYKQNQWRIAVLEEELTHGDFSTKDSVTGSSLGHPYIARSFVVSGMDEGRRAMLEGRLRQLDAKCRKVEEFVDGIEDGEMGALVKLHYLQGLSWPKVRRKLRVRYVTADALRKKTERFLEKI